MYDIGANYSTTLQLAKVNMNFSKRVSILYFLGI